MKTRKQKEKRKNARAKGKKSFAFFKPASWRKSARNYAFFDEKTKMYIRDWTAKDDKENPESRTYIQGKKYQYSLTDSRRYALEENNIFRIEMILADMNFTGAWKTIRVKNSKNEGLF